MSATPKPLTPEAAAQARSKFEELKKLLEQRQLVNLELISKLAKSLEKVKTVPGAGPILSGAAAASKQAAAAKRASQPLGLGPDPKRQRLDSEADKRILDVWRLCSNVLEFLTKKKSASVFLRPVEPARDGVPDYHKVRWVLFCAFGKYALRITPGPSMYIEIRS
jgi:hypothetical protein